MKHECANWLVWIVLFVWLVTSAYCIASDEVISYDVQLFDSNVTARSELNCSWVENNAQRENVRVIVGFKTRELPQHLVAKLKRFILSCPEVFFPVWRHAPRNNPAYRQANGTDFIIVEECASSSKHRLLDALSQCMSLNSAEDKPAQDFRPKYVSPDYKLNLLPKSNILNDSNAESSTRSKVTHRLKVMQTDKNRNNEHNKTSTTKNTKSAKSRRDHDGLRKLSSLKRQDGPKVRNSMHGLMSGGSVAAAARTMADALWEVGVKGQGVRVAVFDSGLHPLHPHFRRDMGDDISDDGNAHLGKFTSSIEESIDWTTEGTENDLVGHGTFVSSVIAGQHSSFPGLAPETKILSMRIFTQELVSLTSWFLDGFNYALASQVDIVSVSLGGTDYLDGPFTEKVAELVAAGIIVVSAIGNDGPLFGTLNNPGDHPEVLAVGGLLANFGLAPFSARGMTLWELQHGGYGRVKPDILAIGRKLKSSAHIPDTPIPRKNEELDKIQIPDPGFRELSGTSVACPVVTGAIALLISANRQLAKLEALKSENNPVTIRRPLNAASIKQILLESALRLDVPQKFPTALSKKGSSEAAKSSITPKDWYDLTPTDFESRRATSPRAGIFEQGSGALELIGAFKSMVDYKPKVSLIPSKLDLTPSACPYMWPFCEQPLYATQVPLPLNVTLLNGMSVSGKIEKYPTWNITSVLKDLLKEENHASKVQKHGAEGNQQSAHGGADSVTLPNEFGAALLNMTFSYPRQLWPYSGFIGIHFEVVQDIAEPIDTDALSLAKTGPIIISGEITITIVTDEWFPQRSEVVLPFSVRVIPRPPRERRLLWDQFRSIPFPHGYAPRDDLDAGTDILDSHGDHPHTNFRTVFKHLVRNRGYFIEILNTDYTCFDANNYGALLIIDPEEEFFIEEISKIVQDVKFRGLSLVVFADWHNENAMHAVRFYDENTQRLWRPFTGGANLPALNSLLYPFGITFGNRIFSGRFRLGVIRPRPWHQDADYQFQTSESSNSKGIGGLNAYDSLNPPLAPAAATPSFFASGSSLVTFPKGGYVVSLPVQDLTPAAAVASKASPRNIIAAPSEPRDKDASSRPKLISNRHYKYRGRNRLTLSQDSVLNRPTPHKIPARLQSPVTQPVAKSAVNNALDSTISWRLRAAQPVLGIFDVKDLPHVQKDPHQSNADKEPPLPASHTTRSTLWDTIVTSAAASQYTRNHARAFKMGSKVNMVKSGRIAVFGDSSCLDGAYRTTSLFHGTSTGAGSRSGAMSPAANTAFCLPLLDAMVDYAALGRRDPLLFPESAKLPQPFRAKNFVDRNHPTSGVEHQKDKQRNPSPLSENYLVTKPRRLPFNDLHLHSRVLAPNAHPACYSLRRKALVNTLDGPRQDAHSEAQLLSPDAEEFRVMSQGVTAGLIAEEIEEMEHFAKGLAKAELIPYTGNNSEKRKHVAALLKGVSSSQRIAKENRRKLLTTEDDENKLSHEVKTLDTIDDGSGFSESVFWDYTDQSSRMLLHQNRFGYFVPSHVLDIVRATVSSPYLPIASLVNARTQADVKDRLHRIYGHNFLQSLEKMDTSRTLFGPRPAERAAATEGSLYDPSIGYLQPVVPAIRQTSVVLDPKKMGRGILSRIRQGYSRVVSSAFVICSLSLLLGMFIHFYRQTNLLIALSGRLSKKERQQSDKAVGMHSKKRLLQASRSTSARLDTNMLADESSEMSPSGQDLKASTKSNYQQEPQTSDSDKSDPGLLSIISKPSLNPLPQLALKSVQLLSDVEESILSKFWSQRDASNVESDGYAAEKQKLFDHDSTSCSEQSHMHKSSDMRKMVSSDCASWSGEPSEHSDYENNDFSDELSVEEYFDERQQELFSHGLIPKSNTTGFGIADSLFARAFVFSGEDSYFNTARASPVGPKSPPSIHSNTSSPMIHPISHRQNVPPSSTSNFGRNSGRNTPVMLSAASPNPHNVQYSQYTPQASPTQMTLRLSGSGKQMNVSNNNNNNITMGSFTPMSDSESKTQQPLNHTLNTTMAVSPSLSNFQFNHPHSQTLIPSPMDLVYNMKTSLGPQPRERALRASSRPSTPV